MKDGLMFLSRLLTTLKKEKLMKLFGKEIKPDNILKGFICVLMHKIQESMHKEFIMLLDNDFMLIALSDMNFTSIICH